MSSITFKFKLIPTLFTIPAMIVLLFLGTWQVQRLYWKSDLVAKINMRSAAEAVTLPEDGFDLNELEYSRVKISGRFLNDKEIYLFTGARQFKGQAGYNVITPFETDEGRLLMVDRGWVPSDKKDSETRPESLINGDTSLIGMIQKGESPAYFTPENDPEKNMWFWIDLDTIYKGLNTEGLGYFIRALNDGNKAGGFPIAGEATIKYRNDHLEYAITWYSLAIILLVIYFLFHIKRVDS